MKKCHINIKLVQHNTDKRICNQSAVKCNAQCKLPVLMPPAVRSSHIWRFSSVVGWPFSNRWFATMSFDITRYTFWFRWLTITHVWNRWLLAVIRWLYICLWRLYSLRWWDTLIMQLSDIRRPPQLRLGRLIFRAGNIYIDVDISRIFIISTVNFSLLLYLRSGQETSPVMTKRIIST